MRMANGDERARGTNVFQLGADGRIESVTGVVSELGIGNSELRNERAE
jgi:hypothetical protein